MSETAIVALIAAVIAGIPPTLVAWKAFRQSEVTAKKADVIIEKAVEIHTLTNSQLSKVTAALEVANEKIIGLEKLIANMIPQKES